MKELDLRNTKIYVNGKSKELQEKLFKMGCVWKDSKNNEFTVYLEFPFIYINNKLELQKGNNMNVFCNTERKELQVQDVLDYEIPKTYWKDELKGGNYEITTDCKYGIYTSICWDKIKPSVIVYDNNEQAELTAKKLELHLEMLRFAELRNGDWEAKEEDYNEGVWGIRVNKEFAYIDTDYYENSLFLQIPFKSEEIAEEALELFGERIKEVYL
ncbi:hypothetical protein [Capnocytophaga haemolytica]